MSAAVDLSPALADLFSRAGASDTDRPAWLAARRAGLTATEVRDLRMKGPSFRRQLIERKLGRVSDVDDLSHVPEIGWGRARESAIAAEAKRRFNIDPESRVFHAQNDSRFLFSPDGVGTDWEDTLLISEYKTDGKDVAPWTDRFREKGYLFQMTWGMRVSGARRCLYGWEIREGSREDGFHPGELRFEWIQYDEQLSAELEAEALAFLDELDAARESNPVENDELAMLIDADVELNAAAKRARAAIEEYVASRGVASFACASGSVSYSVPAPRQSFDQASFKAAHPDIYQEFVKVTAASKPTLRVTPSRKQEEAA